jgi:uncharacterized cupredoxin-like copper-binding protein
VPALLRWPLAAAAASAGALLGLSGAPEVAEQGPDDLQQLLGTPIAVAGELLLGAAVVLATVLSFKRFAPGATAAGRRASGTWREPLLAGATLMVILIAGVVAHAVSGPAHSGLTVTLRDFSVTLSQTTAAAGTVSFDVTNAGPSAHQFWVYRTDLPAGTLPVEFSLGRVSESGSGYQVQAWFIDELQPGGSKTLDELDLEAGRYEVMCNIPAHYREGMFATLTVA